MSLELGANVGPYRIEALIGAGGMGEVYRAIDTRLDRTVAIKVLPAELASDPERRERFEREAKSISSLNHPHICTLFDVGHQDGIDFLVMEHLDGDTLQDRLSRGALPLDQALRYAIEIADALDTAHRRGIVHRDLKPGNVMLTKAGAKLLDFGLAKLMWSGFGTEASGTTAAHLTRQDTILGTLPYMAPEQLTGGSADNRTDIWALGCVAYEMVTGHRPFAGESKAAVMAAILERDPQPVPSLQPMAPLALNRLVVTCLAKDPEERWRAAGDVARQLSWVVEDRGADGIAIGRSRLWQRPVPLLLGTLLLTAITGLSVWSLARDGPPRTGRFVLATSAVFGNPTIDLAISPDGTRLIRTSGDAEFGTFSSALAPPGPLQCPTARS